MLREEWLDERRTEEIARRVREELARRRISRQALADMARISISTLEKALSGRRAFTLGTVVRLEEALGTPLRARAPASDAPNVSAPDELGGYARGAARWLEGRYLTLRPLFGESGIHAFATTIRWEPALSRLIFEESERADSFAQHGSVSLPLSSGHIYLITSEEGQYRLAILGRPTISRSLYGILTTLIIGHGSQLVPASCPLALLRVGESETPSFGCIDPTHPDHARYHAELATVTARDFARFPTLTDRS